MLNDENGFQQALQEELNARTKLEHLPSAKMQAWRDCERQEFAALGRHPLPKFMGYNLYTDTARSLQWCHQMVTDPQRRKLEGLSAITYPRRVLCVLARAIGYRYWRGLETIENKLNGAVLDDFNAQRQNFRQEFSRMADAAHLANARGEAPHLVMPVVLMVEAELLALCPWLECVGANSDARQLLENAHVSGRKGTSKTYTPDEDADFEALFVPMPHFVRTRI